MKVVLRPEVRTGGFVWWTVVVDGQSVARFEFHQTEGALMGLDGEEIAPVAPVVVAEDGTR